MIILFKEGYLMNLLMYFLLLQVLKGGRNMVVKAQLCKSLVNKAHLLIWSELIMVDFPSPYATKKESQIGV